MFIQQWHNLQDIRLIDPFLKLQLPTVGTGFVVGTSSLIGLPSSLGAYSKEYIFEINYSESFSIGFGNWIFTLFGALFSMLYVTLYVAAYLDCSYFTNYKKITIKHLKGESFGLTSPIVGLMLFNLFSPDFINSLFNFNNLFDNYLMVNNAQTLNVDYLFNYWHIKILPAISIIFIYFIVWIKTQSTVLVKYGTYNIPNHNKFGVGVIYW